MRFLDVQHDWFRPIWRRVLTVAFCLGWGGFELASGMPFWAILFIALGLYCAYQFFWVFDPPSQSKGQDAGQDAGEDDA